MSDSDEKKPSRPEISFLPPLKMVLAFFDREARKRMLKKDDTVPLESKEEQDVKRIIDRLNNKDQSND
jgi:hypothetical protein